ncbi:MAG: GNAT family N-acetyltransferase [Solirubrobacterales bacterium]
MRRELPGGFELDDDPARVDVDAVHDFLANHSYWAKGRPRDVVERLVREATRVIGLYRGDDQVGFARVVSDGEVFAYLADAYVLPDARGRGLGVEVVREAVDGGPQRDLRWLLGTADANELYAKLGFGPVSSIMLERLPAGGNPEP